MRHSRATSISRTVAAIATAVLVAATIAGCASDKKPKPSASTMNTIAAHIQSKLAARPEVTKAEVVYKDNITAPGSTLVSIMVKPGSDLNPVADDALRLVWTSKLNPLKTIDLGVTDSGDNKRGVTKSVVLLNADEKAAMEAQYGPRSK